MTLAQFGVSHHDVALPLLESISRYADSMPRALLERGSPHVSGAVVVNTCNRVELYVEGPDEQKVKEVTRQFIGEHVGEVLPDQTFPAPRMNEDAARHLFSVAVGLESMVVGESEIAGQVRRAVSTARKEGTVAPSLERLFRAASSTARQVTNTTGLGSAGRSLVTVALDLIEETEGPLAGRSALVIGTGAYARVVHAALDRRGALDRYIFSLSDRAHAFAESHGGRRVSQMELLSALSSVDVVVASSGAPHPILETDMLAAATKERRTPMPVVDLALTRDVDARVMDVANVRLIDLELIAQHAPREHSGAITAAQRAVTRAARDFAAIEAERTADDVIVAMRSMVHSAMAKEIERVRRREGDEAASTLQGSLHRVEREILHVPTVRSRQLTREGRLDEVEHALQVLLGLSLHEVDSFD